MKSTSKKPAKKSTAKKSAAKKTVAQQTTVRPIVKEAVQDKSKSLSVPPQTEEKKPEKAGLIAPSTSAAIEPTEKMDSTDKANTLKDTPKDVSEVPKNEQDPKLNTTATEKENSLPQKENIQTEQAMPTPTFAAEPSGVFSSKLITAFALILAGAAVIFSVIAWQYATQIEKKLEATQNSQGEPIAAASKAALEDVQKDLRSLKSNFDALSAESRQQTNLLADIYSHPKTDMLPLSIRSLLTSAELQMTLSNDVKPLLTALTSIDQQLVANGMRDDNVLRQAIAADIDLVRNHETSNPVKMATNISQLIARIGNNDVVLPTRAKTPIQAPEIDLSLDVDLSGAPSLTTNDAESSTWDAVKKTWNWTTNKASEIGSAAWDEVSTLVQVTPYDNSNKVITLTPNESVVMRENIKLRLMGVRITILYGQYQQANTELTDIYKTIETYFDTNNASTQSVLRDINALSAELSVTSFPKPQNTLAALNTLELNQ